MCCFSRPVKLVADTNIFARGSKEGRQFHVSGKVEAGSRVFIQGQPVPVEPGGWSQVGVPSPISSSSWISCRLAVWNRLPRLFRV